MSESIVNTKKPWRPPAAPADVQMERRLRTRKFLGFVLAALLSAGGLYLGKIGGGEYMTIILALYGTFVTGNVKEKADALADRR